MRLLRLRWKSLQECLIVCGEKVLSCKELSETFIHGRQTCSVIDQSVSRYFVVFMPEQVWLCR